MARIMFVDDDILTLRLLEKEAQYLGHEPIVTSSYGAALNLALEKKPQLIVVDLFLQDTSGFGLIKHLKENSELMNIPMLIMSAGNSASDESEALKAGASGFLFKPVCMDDIVRAVKTYI
jgi:DNA-binding response OmpR family regulator